MHVADPNEKAEDDVINVRLDACESEIIHHAALASRLTVGELVSFSINRQLEAWNGLLDYSVFSVLGSAQNEMAQWLQECIKTAVGIEAVVREMTYVLPNGNTSSEVKRLSVEDYCTLLNGLAKHIYVAAVDTRSHLESYVVPALLERVPPSLSSLPSPGAVGSTRLGRPAPEVASGMAAKQ